MGNTILLNNLSFLERTKLKLVSKIFPVKEPEVLLLDKIEIDLRKAKVSQINIPSIFLPQITFDFCPVKPELIELKTTPSHVKIITCQNIKCLRKLRIEINALLIGRKFKITCPTCHHFFIYSPTEDELIEDLTAWLKEQLFFPEIESFSILLDIPKRAGKSYWQAESGVEQALLFGVDEDCIHGLKKSVCSFCIQIQKERQERERTPQHIDPFDLIFPILQPPLGENFDNPIAFPPGAELYPFQRVGVEFLAEHEIALLGDEMGLGKSIQAIVTIRFLFRMGKIIKGLILCPKSVLTDWEEKLWKWAPELRVIKVRGPKEQREIYWHSPAHIYLTTYETLRQDLSGSLEGNNDVEDIVGKQFDFIILDEIQKIKNPSADITKATRMIDARIRWGLSGTPLENRLEDLISIFAYLNPGLLRYGDPHWRVKEAIKSYFLRRRISDALPELPKKEVGDPVWLELGPNQRATYDRAEQDGIVGLNEQGDLVTVQHVLALITKLKQICNIDPVSKESCKLEYLLEKLEEISEQGDKALVFSQYPEKTLCLLEPELKQFSPLVYHGSLSDSQRDSIVKRFQKEEENKVLLMSVKAGGLGLTLTKANYIFHFDLWWNPSVADQAEGRIWRIGQTKTVFVESLLAEGTIERRIDKILKKKRELFKVVIDDLSDEKLSKFLTEDELFGLFGLQKPKRGTLTNLSPKGIVTLDILKKISSKQFEELIANGFIS